MVPDKSNLNQLAKDWNNIMDKIAPEDLMECFEVIKKIKNTLL